MNEDEMQAIEPQPGETLERMLARYARVRLDPSPAEVRRARAAVMEEAYRRHLALADAPTPIHARRGLFSGWSARRVGLSLSAAVMAGLLLGTTTFAASRAGGPLYEARIALEDATLPADAAARVDAEIRQAQGRLADVVDAVARHDDAATADALAAFNAVTARLVDATGANADRALAAVLFHQTVLTAVLANAPESAQAGLTTAIAASGAVVTRLEDKGATAPGNGDGAGGGGSNGGGGAGHTPKPIPTNKPDTTQKPDHTAKPGRTQDPVATPKPAKTPDPAATPKPGRTPKPKPTPPADNGQGGAPGASAKP